MGSTATKKSSKSTKLKDYISWFEIPALDITRALGFYNHIYQLKMETLQMNGYSMAFFPADKGIGGAVVAGEGCVPGQAGPLVYLNGGKDLNAVLGKVNEAGGRVVMSKTLINKESGYFAIFIDTEGNRLALHSKN
jgi:predicted enzyme related to lactoylglutathione lyase